MGEATIRRPLKSGHCSTAGHERCQRNGGFQRANPAKEFQPCPCWCHYPTDDVEFYECGECGKIIIEATYWPLDEDEDPRYTHLDIVLNDEGEIIGGTGEALGEECHVRVSRNDPSLPVDNTKDCTRCGDPFTPKGRERICSDCRAAEVEELIEDDFSDLDDLDKEEEEIDELDALLAEFEDD